MKMAMYTWAELLKLWETERLSVEQVIGQLLQQGQQSQTAALNTQRQLAALEQRVAALEGQRK